MPTECGFCKRRSILSPSGFTLVEIAIVLHLHDADGRSRVRRFDEVRKAQRVVHLTRDAIAIVTPGDLFRGGVS